MNTNNIQYAPNFIKLNLHKIVSWRLILAQILVLPFIMNGNKLQAQASPSFVPNPAVSMCTGDNTAILCYNLVAAGTDGDGIINSVNIILDDSGSMSPNLVIASWGDDDPGDALGGMYSITSSPTGNSVLNYADVAGRPDGSVIGTVCFTTTSVDGSGSGFTINVNAQDAAFFPSQIDGVNITAENDLVIVGSDTSTTPCPVGPDTDGDGVSDNVDTNPMDPCLPVQTAGFTGYNISNPTWLAADCDEDGVTNGTEFNAGFDPYDPASRPSVDNVEPLPNMSELHLIVFCLLIGIASIFFLREPYMLHPKIRASGLAGKNRKLATDYKKKM